MAAGAPSIQIRKKSGKGCFGCGCGFLVVILLLILAFIVACCTYLYRTAHDLTTPAAVAVPPADGGETVYFEAHQKVEDFGDAFERQQPATLRLNTEEINTLIARDPTYAGLRGHVTVTLKGDEATIDSSLLLGTVEKTAFPDRYLNSSATLGLSFDPAGHVPLFDLHRLQVKDQELPLASNAATHQLLNQMMNQGAAQRLKDNQIARDFLARVQKMDIEDGVLVIQMK